MQDAVQETEKRWVRIETPESSGMHPGLHLNYEEGFFNSRSQQVPGVFTDPLFLPNMVNSVYQMAKPPISTKPQPFSAAKDLPTTPMESVDDRGDMVTPGPSLSTAGPSTAGKSTAGLTEATAQVIGDSDTESDKTVDLESEKDSSYSAPAPSVKSDHALRKRTHGQSEGSMDNALPSKRVAFKKKKEADDPENSSSTGPSQETLCDHRFAVYGKEVRAKILSLKAGTKPTQQDIDSSSIFS